MGRPPHDPHSPVPGAGTGDDHTGGRRDVKPHIHSCCSSSPTVPDTQPQHRAYLIRACLRGTEPLEVLAVAGMHTDRDALLAEFTRRGWTVAQIAQHTRMTTYTVGRLVGQLGLAEAIQAQREAC